MSWLERLREAAITSSTGVRVTFDFEDVSKTIEKKTTAFEFPDADGTLVQDNGRTGNRFPMKVIFWGENHDKEAEFFEAVLLVSGDMKLEHPIYGVFDVVPFGAITRRDDLKTAANQTIFTVAFWETIGLVYPTGQDDPASSVLSAVEEYNDAVADEFEEVTDLDTAVERSTFRSSYTALLDTAQGGLQAIANVQDDVATQFNAIVDSINGGIDVLIGQPLTLAFQTTQLLQAPARALTAIEARLDGYKNLVDSIIGGDDAVLSPGSGSRNSNQFHTNDLYASTYVSGSIVSVVNNQFTTKTEALEAAVAILQQMEDVTDWRDLNFESLEQVDTGGSYQQLQEAVALAAGFLVQISFSLKQERRIVLDRPRTFVDLVAELYGVTDDKFDFVIRTNDLSGSEHIELQRGREIVYYV